MMPIEKQVVSLELAKKLKELGVKQESCFVWEIIGGNATIVPEHYSSPHTIKEIKRFSAFTCAELGEMLPSQVNGFSLRILKDGGFFWIGYWELGNEDELRFEQYHDFNEANSRAKMLIYLLENGLMGKERG